MLSVPVGAYTLEVPADMAWCFESGSYYERNVATWFERIARTLGGGAVYDVGANCGYYSLLAAQAGATVYAFEPVEATFETLHGNLEQAPGATAFPVGLASASGQHSIQLYSSSGNNSLFPRTLPPGHSLIHQGSQTVELVALDDFADERGLAAPGLIKLDIEGAELSAIGGARGLIARHRPYLIVEYSDSTARDAGYDRGELVSELRALGYDLYALSSDESDETAYPLDAPGIPAVDNLIAVPAGRSLPQVDSQPTLDLLIYSKDRPAQLELLLRSGDQLFDEWDEIGLTVVFTYSAAEFERGYELVRGLHPGVRFVDEHDTGETFKETTLRLLGGADHTVFLVDDDVFKQPFSLGSEEVQTFARDPEIACLSLRMCPRMDYCYALDRVTGVPAFEDGTTWRWRDAEGDWGYPMSLDGHIFRTREVMPLLEALPFHHPNSLESVLADHPLAAPKAVCFADSKIVNIPANRVQDTHQNRHMGLATPEELNERFLAGERIALEPIRRVANVSPHHEMALEWEPGEHRPAAAPGPSAARTVVFADELIERPELAVVYADSVEAGRDSELVIYAPDADPAEAGRRVSAVLVELSLDDRELDMTLLAVPAAEGDDALASCAQALLTERPAPPAFAALPSIGAAELRGWIAPPSAPALSRDRVVDHIGRQKVDADPQTWAWYLADLEAYQTLPGAERLELADLNPQLHDQTPTNPYDGHYFFQDVWAARRVADARPKRHVDVGSRVDYVGFLTALTDVTFVDIRPLDADIEGLTSVAGSILEMPFEDRSLESVSCLHVAEHIGLGRYGDPLEPLGTRKAAAELQRVVAPGGQLLFALPVGRPRVCFNAHRVHSPHDIAAMFPELDLIEFSGVDDRGVFRRQRSLDELEGAEYSCGMFRFVRPGDSPEVRVEPDATAQPVTGTPAERFYGQFVTDGDLVFDVGANMGNRSETFLALGASVIAVEPQAELAAQLRARWAGEPRLRVIEYGLSDREGEAELFVSDAHVLTTMTPDWIEATTASGRFAEYSWDERRVVPTTTLASLIDCYGTPAFCKIDVEGFEETVLAGLDRPLPACSLEFACERLPALRRCLERLAELGPIECNYSVGESLELAQAEWVGGDELYARLVSLPGHLPWGDVYVRSRG